jgi:anti-sigma-K factor RskA
MDRNDLLELIPAYALGALDPEERAAVEALLKTDAEAQTLLAEYQGVTESLAFTVPARRAPAHLQADLKARLAAQRTAPMAESIPTPPPASPRPTLQKRSLPLWAPVMVAIAAALAVIVGALLFFQPQEPSPEQVFETIAALPDALRYPVQTGAAGEVVVAPDGRAAVRLTDIPAIDSDQVLQLWVVKPDGPVSVAVFTWADPAGVYYALVRSITPDDQAVAFSREAAPGRTTEQGPTEVVVVAPLTPSP